MTDTAKGHRWTPETVRALGVTTDLATAASVLGIGRSKAYELVHNDQFPVPLIKTGTRYVVPTAPLLAILGADESPDTMGEHASGPTPRNLPSDAVYRDLAQVQRPGPARGARADRGDLAAARATSTRGRRAVDRDRTVHGGVRKRTGRPDSRSQEGLRRSGRISRGLQVTEASQPASRVRRSAPGFRRWRDPAVRAPGAAGSPFAQDSTPAGNSPGLCQETKPRTRRLKAGPMVCQPMSGGGG